MKTWLFKPFERMAGGPALVTGLLAIVVTAWAAHHAGGHTGSVVSLQIGAPLRFSTLITHGLVNWLCAAVLLWAVGHWLTSSRYRILDLFGTQALARWPLLPPMLLLLIPSYRQAMETRAQRLTEATLQAPGQVTADMALLGDALFMFAMSIPLLLAVIWVVWLAFHGYALVFNLKGARAVLAFIGALVAAVILSTLINTLL